MYIIKIDRTRLCARNFPAKTAIYRNYFIGYNGKNDFVEVSKNLGRNNLKIILLN